LKRPPPAGIAREKVSKKNPLVDLEGRNPAFTKKKMRVTRNSLLLQGSGGKGKDLFRNSHNRGRTSREMIPDISKKGKEKVLVRNALQTRNGGVSNLEQQKTPKGTKVWGGGKKGRS